MRECSIRRIRRTNQWKPSKTIATRIRRIISHTCHKLAGYRELTPVEIDLINRIKETEQQVGELLASISYGNPGGGAAPEGVADARWFAIAKTDLQKGFMALVRSIAKPEGF